MHAIGRLLSRIVSLAAVIGMLCVMLMMLHVTADVTMRYVFNSPIPGTITIVANYYMVILGFIALAVAEEKDAHISVEVVADLMPAFMQRPLAALAAALATGIFATLTWRTIEVAQQQTAIGAKMPQGTVVIWTWPTYWALPIGCGLMAIVAFYKLAIAVTGLKSGLQPDRPVVETDEDGPSLERTHD